jgi:hypothetical protein
MDQNSATDSRRQAEIKGYIEIQQSILNDINQRLGSLGHPQTNAQQERDAVNAQLQQLQIALDDENSENAK